MASQGFSKSSRENSVKGLTYEIGQEQGVFSFAADAGENTEVWFKHYTTPSAFEATEAEYGSSWSWMGNPGAVEAPNSGALNPENGAKLAVHQLSDGTKVNNFAALGGGSDGAADMTWDGDYLWHTDFRNSWVYKFTKSGTQKDQFQVSFTPQGITFDGQYLWISNDRSGNIYQFKTDGTDLNNDISVPWSNTGLAWDGSYLWSGGEGTAYRLKTDGTEVSNFAVGGNENRGITHDGVYLYLTEFSSSTIYRYTKGGTRKDSFSGPATNAHGVTWDGEYLWHSDFTANVIYQLSGSASLNISYRVNSIT